MIDNADTKRELKAIQFVATENDGSVKDIIDLRPQSVYTKRGYFTKPVQDHLDRWFKAGCYVARVDVYE